MADKKKILSLDDIADLVARTIEELEVELEEGVLDESELGKRVDEIESALNGSDGEDGEGGGQGGDGGEGGSGSNDNKDGILKRLKDLEEKIKELQKKIENGEIGELDFNDLTVEDVEEAFTGDNSGDFASLLELIETLLVEVIPVERGGLGTTTIEGAKAKLGIPEIISTLDETHSAGVNLARGTRDFTQGSNQVASSIVYSDGFYYDKTYVKTETDKEGFSILNINRSSLSSDLWTPIRTNAIPYKSGGSYTWSFKIKFDKTALSENATAFAGIEYLNHGDSARKESRDITFSSVFSNKSEIVADKWYDCVVVFKATDAVYDYLRISIYLQRNGSISISRIMLQEGDIHNPTWSPHPLDVIQQSDARVIRQVQQGTGQSVNNYVWLGRNIAELHKDAIGTQEPITWLKNIAAAGTFNQYDLQIGDYLECPLSDGKDTKMLYQIAGFDIYYGIEGNGHMITLVPASCYSEKVPFNDTNTNQGTSTEKTPWRASNLFKWCNETFYNYLPTTWKSALKNIKMYQSVRYSTTNLNNDSGGEWINIGFVWVPSEIEVYGCVRRGTQTSGPANIVCTDKHFPIFDNGRTTIRSQFNWWERVACADSVTHICYVWPSGAPSVTNADAKTLYPLPCIHIG